MRRACAKYIRLTPLAIVILFPAASLCRKIKPLLTVIALRRLASCVAFAALLCGVSPALAAPFLGTTENVGQ